MKEFTHPFRVGKKQTRAVLDAKGHEVVVFPRGLEQLAIEYCEFLNSKYNKTNIIVSCEYSQQQEK